MSGCGNCCGSCGGCGELILAEGEIRILQALGQIPFLPVARRAEEDIPVYLEDEQLSPEEASLCIQCLEKRGLIDIDWQKPLSGSEYGRYTGYPIRGSMGLTARGQQVLEQIEIQGI